MIKLCFTFLLFLSAANLFPQTQLDTSEYFPLQKGDHWEYILQDMGGDSYTFYTVIGDTLMPNEKQYKTIRISNPGWPYYDYYFSRNEGNLQYHYFRDSTCPAQEYVIYNFETPDSTIWPVCYGIIGVDYRSCMETYNEYLQIFNWSVETKIFVYAEILGKDTILGPGFTGITHVSKNIGVTFMGNEGSVFLSGAILNGVTYGNIVGIKDKFTDNTIPNDLKLNIYPNPFNNSTKIYFSLPKTSNIELKIYNILGEKLHEITRGKYNAGEHQISFNSSGFGSGIYILLLSTDSQILSKKIILLK